MSIDFIGLLFFTYSFLGWISEVLFALVKSRKFVNRGFLYGPICPIYGIGILCCVQLLKPFHKNNLILFVASMIITTLLELLTGTLLEKLFHTKWWDYSNRPFHFKGYICLEFTILWGLAALFMIQYVHPHISKLITSIPKTWALLLFIIFTIILIADMRITLKYTTSMFSYKITPRCQE